MWNPLLPTTFKSQYPSCLWFSSNQLHHLLWLVSIVSHNFSQFFSCFKHFKMYCPWKWWIDSTEAGSPLFIHKTDIAQTAAAKTLPIYHVNRPQLWICPARRYFIFPDKSFLDYSFDMPNKISILVAFLFNDVAFFLKHWGIASSFYIVTQQTSSVNKSPF